jgi:hypothetical protein
MTAVVLMADQVRDEFGAATIFVHHSGKDAGRGARGHTSLFAAADTVVCVADRVATVEKSRDGISGETFPFSLEVVNLGEDADGDPITTCVLKQEQQSEIRSQVKLNDSENICFDALKEAVSMFGEILPETSAIPRGAKAATIENWRTTFDRKYGEERSSDAAKKAFNRAKTRLIASKLAGVSAPWAWLW